GDGRRPPIDGGSLRRRRERLADAHQRHRAAVQAGHRHWFDLRRHHRHGRLHHLRRNGRRADRLGRQDDRDTPRRAAIPARGGQRGDPARRDNADHRRAQPHRRHPQGALGVNEGRSLAFYALAAVFGLYVLFLYGPMIVIFVLSFQGPTGGLTFPLNGVSLHWFLRLWVGGGIVDISGAFMRSLELGLVVMVLTVVFSLSAGLAFRKRFLGANLLFYITIASLIVPSLGIALEFRMLDDFLKANAPDWIADGLTTTMGMFTSGLGAHLTWTLPFGLLVMFAIFNRFDSRYEEAARDLGATPWQTLRHVVLPIILPSVIGVGLFGFTLSWDE